MAVYINQSLIDADQIISFCIAVPNTSSQEHIVNKSKLLSLHAIGRC